MVAIATTRADKSESSDQRKAPIRRLLMLPSCLGRYSAALLEDKIPVHRFAMAGNREGSRRHQPDHRIQGGGPFIKYGVGAKGRRTSRFQQIAGKQHIGVRHHNHEVSIGVPPAEMSDLDPAVTELDRRRDSYFHVRLAQLLKIHTQSLPFRGRFGGRESEVQRLMPNPWHVREGTQSKCVVVVPVSDYHGSQRLVRHGGERRANRTALGRARSGVHQQAPLRPNDESEVHRIGLGNCHVHA